MSELLAKVSGGVWYPRDRSKHQAKKGSDDKFLHPKSRPPGIG